jgi:uncharacterized protein YkwD
MSWASNPTTEMPTGHLPPTGHRNRRRGLIAIVAVGAAVVVVAVVLVLTGRPGAPPETATVRAGQSGGATGAVSQRSTVDSSQPGALEAQVADLTNAERAGAGCPALPVDASLASAARAHSTDMATTGVFAHNGSDGADPGARMKAAGYDSGPGWAENIARGQATPAAVMEAWMGSPDHRANILNCEFKAIGVGVARSASGQLFWTQDFGRR